MAISSPNIRNMASLGAMAFSVAAPMHADAAALSFTGSPITTNFDSMAGSAGTIAFLDDATIPGLHLYLSGGSGAVAGSPDAIYRGTTTSTAPTTGTYTSGTSHAFYFYRADGSTNVSLGFYNTDGNSSGLGTGFVAAGFEYSNNTGQTIPSVSFSYDVFASSNSFTNADPVTVSWALNADGVNDTEVTWTTVTGMGYSVSAGGVLTYPTVTTIDNVNWAPGDTLMVRFTDRNVGGTDRYSRIDNVRLIPEPATALLAGMAGVLALVRRRRG